MTSYRLVCVVAAVAVYAQVIAAAELGPCRFISDYCTCGGTVDLEVTCNIDGRRVKYNLFEDAYFIITCDNPPSTNYDLIPMLNPDDGTPNSFKSITFKNCPIPPISYRNVLDAIAVNRTLSLIIQNEKKLAGVLERKHFEGLQDVPKLLLSVNGVTHLPDDLFADMQNLTWLTIRSNGIVLSEKLFMPLERLETLEISHNQMTNISANLFSHLSFLRKLSLWQSNVTRFSQDLFTGVDVLEELDLSSNGLNELPQSIFNPLKNLRKLTLFSNKFSTLPTNLFKNNDYLDTVIILNNDVKLMELPRRFLSKLSNLKEVYIQRCELEKIPQDAFFDSPEITNISLAYNAIQELPEAVFNDQINLLELDLSHNKLVKLEPKLFSSLVKLEKLKLCHNFLKEISGTTFSSLLSLIYLDMENNNLNAITTYLFSNNKQRMSINMAYNELDFENRDIANNSGVKKEISPFAFTFNLRLLNLSHNKFKITFDDWWMNGHEFIDISYNDISELLTPNMTKDSWDENNKMVLKRKTTIKIWICGNPMASACELLKLFKGSEGDTEFHQSDLRECSSTLTCKHPRSKWRCIIRGIICFNIFVMISVVVYRKEIYKFIKKILKNHVNNTNKVQEVVVSYTSSDEKFILQELLPGLTNNTNFKIHVRPLQEANNRKSVVKTMLSKTFDDPEISIVVFSPNYLTSVYHDINIKKIKGEMMKMKNAIFLFVDIGPENSIHAFLKQQRDIRTTVIWDDLNFWNNLKEKLKKTAARNRGFIVQEKAWERYDKASKGDKNQKSFLIAPDGQELPELLVEFIDDYSLV